MKLEALVGFTAALSASALTDQPFDILWMGGASTAWSMCSQWSSGHIARHSSVTAGVCTTFLECSSGGSTVPGHSQAFCYVSWRAFNVKAELPGVCCLYRWPGRATVAGAALCLTMIVSC